jgi:molecular chaperone IbpA
MNKNFNVLWNTTLGFRDMERLLANDSASQFPPHNIIKIDDYKYVIELAVAGFKKQDITVKRIDNVLEIRGYILNNDKDVEYLHKGIATRSFTKRIHLAETVEVRGSELADGVLKIAFENVIPEKKKPVEIEIGEGNEFANSFRFSQHYPKEAKQLLTE